jgi:predicted dehydrogenase
VYDDLKAVGDIDNAVINMRFESGALGNVEISRNARYGYDVRTEILGSNGALIVGGHADDGQHGVLRLTPSSAPRDDETPHFVKRFGAAYKAEIEHFIDCVTHDRQPAVGGADALAAFEIGLAATLACQTGRSVALADLRAEASASNA